jgi:hypothetical protein
METSKRQAVSGHQQRTQSRRCKATNPAVVASILLVACTVDISCAGLFFADAFQSSRGVRFSDIPTTKLSIAFSPEEQALEKTKQQLQKLQQTTRRKNGNNNIVSASKNSDPALEDIEQQIQDYLQLPASAIKEELRQKGLPTKGRKPDLARRLVEYEWQLEHGRPVPYLENESTVAVTMGLKKEQSTRSNKTNLSSRTDRLHFCGLQLSQAASTALQNAQFTEPTPIQREGIPLMAKQGESVILHAATGSGKTLAYLLPITETLWKEEHERDGDLQYAMILTPTRELAAQVAGVASVLAPPGTVRLVTHATNLMSDQQYWKERRGRSGNLNGDTLEQEDYHFGRTSPQLFIGSAKAMMHSLYGDGRMPASPTRKPAALEFLSRTRWVVLDEVDRLLLQPGKKGGGSTTKGPIHEKPAAILTSAVARRTFGRAQVIAASATVGRTLKRELSRVLGFPPNEYPRVVRGGSEEEFLQEEAPTTGHVGRAVTIPETVENYVVAVDSSSVGNVLTNAFFVLKGLNKGDPEGRRKMLMVLTRGCGISTQNAIGALKHFRCQPEPQSLIDVLQSADGADQLIEVHRQVSGSSGVGEAAQQSSYFQKDSEDEHTKGYLLVTGEDSVRGLHLDGLDIVIVVGRAHGPDEYTHIAGRTGRAGQRGKVINILNEQHASAVKGWEKMLDTDFHVLQMDDIETV